jgi:nucleoside-diphosphate-sugar epimerase
MRWFVLGASGFVGRHLVLFLESAGYEVVRLSRPDFDYLSPETYSHLDFTGACVVDCVTNVDGPPDEVRETIVGGLEKLLGQPTLKHAHRFVYISTSTTLNPEVVAKNVYVASKREAEGMVRGIPNAQIVRLSFPFGLNENPNRLVTRMMKSAWKGEDLSVGDVKLPLTPLPVFVERLPEIVADGKSEVNFTDGRVYCLADVAEAVIEVLGRGKCVKDDGNRANYALAEPDVYGNSVDALHYVREMAREFRAAREERE